MSMTKNDIIKELYQSGKISFEQVLSLAGNGDVELKEDGKKEEDLSLAKKITNQFFEYNEEIGRSSFDYENTLKYYKEHNWCWYGVNGDITLKDIRKLAEELVEDVIENLKKQKSEGKEYPYAFSGTGGLEVIGWYEEDEYYTFELKFVPVTGYASCSKI